MEEKLYNVSLTYKEIVMLDGNARDCVQKVVDQAKTENSIGLDSFSNEVIRKAIEQGKLSWGSKKICKCLYCSNKPRGYEKYRSSSRYHRKGDTNYDKPLLYYAVDPMQGFVIFNGGEGMCTDCWEGKYKNKIIQYILDNDLPVEIQKNDFADTKYVKDVERKCYSCGKTMYESEMGVERTFMGNGNYPAKCPHCGAVSAFLGKNHELTGNFRMVKLKEDENK